MVIANKDGSEVVKHEPKKVEAEQKAEPKKRRKTTKEKEL